MSLSSVRVKDEIEWESVVSKEELYAGHEVKQDLVVGPELLQASDVALMPQAKPYTMNQCTEKTGSGLKNQMIKSCSVRLERLPLNKIIAGPSRIYKESGLKFLCKSQLQKNILTCEFCGKLFNRFYQIRNHEVSHVRSLLCNKHEPIASAMCSKFGYIYLEQNDDEPHHCYICKMPFLQSNDLKNHIMRVHPSNGINDVNLTDLESQFKQPDQSEPYNNIHCGKTKKVANFCANCGKEVEGTSKDFIKHLLKHIKTNPDLKEIFKAILKDSQIIKGKRSYSCNICHKQFKERYQLKNHLRVHQERAGFPKKQMGGYCETFSCNVCHRIFTQRKYFERHLCHAITQKSYQCLICKMLFTDVDTLKQHKHFHAGFAGELAKEQIEAYKIKTKSNKSAVSYTLTENESRTEGSVSVQNVNFQESTLFHRLKLLNQTLNSNEVGKSKTNAP